MGDIRLKVISQFLLEHVAMWNVGCGGGVDMAGGWAMLKTEDLDRSLDLVHGEGLRSPGRWKHLVNLGS